MLRDDELATGDCLECLLAIGSASDKGREALLQNKALTTVVHRLSEASPSTLSSSWILLLTALHKFFVVFAPCFPGILHPFMLWLFCCLIAVF